MAGEHVIFWRALSSELGTGTKFILGTSESGLRCEVWSFSAETEREREPDTWQHGAAICNEPSPLSVVSDLKVSGQDIAPEGEHQDNGDNGNWMLEWADRANKALS